MPVMARKKPNKPGEPKADRHANRLISYRPPQAVRSAIERLAARERRTTTQMLNILVEDALAARGEIKLPGEPPKED